MMMKAYSALSPYENVTRYERCGARSLSIHACEDRPEGVWKLIGSDGTESR